MKDDRGVRVYSRRGTDWTGELPGIVEAAAAIGAENFIVDGELVSQTPGDFYALPTAIKKRRVCVVAFDFLHLNGENTRPMMLEDRRVLLEDLLVSNSPIMFSPAFPDGEALLEAAEQRGLEGIVSKRKGLRYQSGTCGHWRKTKSAIWVEANKDRFEKMRT